MKALVVEPDEARRRLIVGILTSRGHEATGLEAGADAVAHFSAEPCELVVAAIELPDRSGTELCRQLRALPGGARAWLLLVTASPDHAHLEELLEAGADDYLVEPLDVGFLNVRLAVVERQASRIASRSSRVQPRVALPTPPPPSRPRDEERFLEAGDTVGDATTTDEVTAEGGEAPSDDKGAKRYDVLGRVGQGGSSEIYKAFDRELGEVVALKIIRNEWSGDEKWAARLRQEIRLTRQVKNEHVAQIFEFGRYGGRFFLAMEFIPGVPLSDVIAERGSIPEDEALDIALQAVDGIAAVHQLGIVHRDLKSSNLMVTPEGKVVVLDFGLARRPEDLRLTHDGMLLGTPVYMAPELIEDRPFGAAADVYSFGCVLYEMLTGQVPFLGKNIVSTARMHLLDKPRPLRTIDSKLSPLVEGIVMRCLAKSADDRYADAAELRVDLKRAHERFAKRQVRAASKRVLLGEPDPEQARWMVELLVRQGLEVESVEDGHHLVETALAGGCDAIFIEVALPKISALEVSHILRSFPRTATVPIVLLSSRGSDQHLAGLIPRGGEFLLKPVQEAALSALVRHTGLSG